MLRKINLILYYQYLIFESFSLAKKVEVDYFKVASSELNNDFLLEYISKTNKKVIISTGMSTEDEIKRCLKKFKLDKSLFTPLRIAISMPRK